ncbi:MAG: LysR family transcriptional regulator [Betaproteobacteria bacterium]|nr:LysR family transcriptional regulator [Betaproteobacteria bacterium]
MGPGRAALIEHIDRHGSISAAARQMEMSYRRAWQLVEAINGAFSQPLVTTATGGKRGGGAQVTEFGREVAWRFRRMELKASASIGTELAAFNALLRPASRPLRRP